MVKMSDPVRRAYRSCTDKMRAAKINDKKLADQLFRRAHRGKLSDEKLVGEFSKLGDAFDLIHRWKSLKGDSGSDGPEDLVLDRKRPCSSRDEER